MEKEIITECIKCGQKEAIDISNQITKAKQEAELNLIDNIFSQIGQIDSQVGKVTIKDYQDILKEKRQKLKAESKED